MFTVKQTEKGRYSILKGKDTILVSNLKYDLSNKKELDSWLVGVMKDPQKVLDEMYEKKYGIKREDVISISLDIEEVPQEIVLRDYQVEDIKNIKRALNENQTVLYSLPTGGGKSVILSSIVDENANKNILILAHKRKLLLQLEGHLLGRGIKPGLVYAGTSKNLDSNIIIGSILSIVKEARMEVLLKRKWDYIIIDEARHTRTPTYDSVLDTLKEHNPKCKILGVDATPYRKDKKTLEKHFKELVLSTEDMKSLIAKGFLADIQTFVSPIGDIRKEVKENANDYVVEELSTYMRKPEYLNYVLDTYKKFGENRQTIVFAVDIEHSKAIVQKFESDPLYKGKVARIDSTLSSQEIDETISLYEKGKIQVLVNVEMLTEGVDLPESACIIGARPTKSLSLYLQMAGRWTRPKQDGKNLILLDCCGWTSEYGQVSSTRQWSLNTNINPNILRESSYVFGIGEDGKYIEELDDYVGEVTELTPEEFIAHLGNNIQQAVQINQRLRERQEEKINKLFATISKFIQVDFEKEKISPTLYVGKGNSPEIVLMWDEEKEIQSYDRTSLVRIEMELGWGWIRQAVVEKRNINTDEKLRKVAITQKIAGDFNYLLATNQKARTFIDKTFIEIKKIEREKVDIDLLEKEKKKEIETKIFDQLNIKLLSGVVKRIHLPKKVSLGSFSRDWWEFDSFELINANKIKNNQNSVAFYKGEERIKVKDYVSGETIKDILTRGEYGRTITTNETDND